MKHNLPKLKTKQGKNLDNPLGGLLDTQGEMKMKQSPLFWNHSGEAQPFDKLSVHELAWLLPHFLFKKSISEHE